MELIPYKERIEGYTRKRLSILNQWRYFNHFEIPMNHRLLFSWEFYYKDVFDEENGNDRKVLAIHHDNTITNVLIMILFTPLIFIIGGIEKVIDFWSCLGSKSRGYYYDDFHYLELDDFMGYGKESSTWLHNLFLKTNLKTLKQNEDGYYVPKD